ncbi:hypothetical protein QQF64_017478 [Cirrhinus molitorella]|uniref:Uncharacterized protein n=1 Tax=Cirrhinus molitorella TaxID=172907 RepID=A0ABR3LIS6_9TELE
MVPIHCRGSIIYILDGLWVLVNPHPPCPGPICSTSSFLHISQSLSQLLSMISCIYFYFPIELDYNTYFAMRMNSS